MSEEFGLIPEKGKILSLFQSIQTGSGAHPVSYSMGNNDSFSRSNSVGE